MATVDKKILIRKKVGSDIYNILPKTSSDIVTHVDNSSSSTTVATLLNSVDARFGTFNTGNTTVMQEIAYQVNEAKKQILGVDSQGSIAQAYDTIVELAQALAGASTGYSAVTPVGGENPSTAGWYEAAGNGQYVASADTEVDDGKTYYQPNNVAVTGLISKVATLQTEVEAASTGLLDRTTALEHSVDGWTDTSGAEPVVHKGLLERVSTLETFNGGLTTDDVPEGTVEDRLYVNTTEKQRISDAAVVQYLASTATDSDITSTSDLYFVELA